MSTELKARRVMISAGGGLGGSGRSVTMPTLANGALSNGAGFFEDFLGPSWGRTNYATGLTATPDTEVNLMAFGNPNWVGTEFGGGNTGTMGNGSVASSSTAYGVFQMITSATNGHALALDLGGISATQGCGLFRFSTTASAIGMWRAASTHAATTGRMGYGWIAPTTAAVGVDWVTDPDTLLNATYSIIIHRDGTSAYSGDTQGAWVLRAYSGGASGATSLQLVAIPTTSQYYKFEVLVDGPGSLISAWVDGVLIGSIAFNSQAGGNTQRPSVQVMATSAAARQVLLDCYYQEVQLPAAR